MVSEAQYGDDSTAKAIVDVISRLAWIFVGPRPLMMILMGPSTPAHVARYVLVKVPVAIAAIVANVFAQIWKGD